VLDFDAGNFTIDASDDASEALAGMGASNYFSDDMKIHTTRQQSYQLPEGVEYEKAISRDGEIRSGKFGIIFYPSGASSGGSIMITNEKRHRHRIDVDVITGTVTLTEQ